MLDEVAAPQKKKPPLHFCKDGSFKFAPDCQAPASEEERREGAGALKRPGAISGKLMQLS
jgi:hypothetical protein